MVEIFRHHEPVPSESVDLLTFERAQYSHEFCSQKCENVFAWKLDYNSDSEVLGCYAECGYRGK